jgi:hypothetical protein
MLSSQALLDGAVFPADASSCQCFSQRTSYTSSLNLKPILRTGILSSHKYRIQAYIKIFISPKEKRCQQTENV